MLQSILLICLFAGLISMLMFDGRNAEWIHFVLIVVLFLSVSVELRDADLRFPDTESVLAETSDLFPERDVLYSAVADRVTAITGSAPLEISSDLEQTEDGYSLSSIRVVISQGNAKEVQDDLQNTFSFQGFTVIGEETARSGETVVVLPEA